MTGSAMTEDEWTRTRWVRRDIVRVVGRLRWYALSVEQCDAVVRDAARRGVEAAVEGLQ